MKLRCLLGRCHHELVDTESEAIPYGAPGPAPESPTERDGLKVDDVVELNPLYRNGGPYPVRIVGFNCLPHDIVVEWLGLLPLSALTESGRSTIDRRYVRIERV